MALFENYQGYYFQYVRIVIPFPHFCFKFVQATPCNIIYVKTN